MENRRDLLRWTAAAGLAGAAWPAVISKAMAATAAPDAAGTIMDVEHVVILMQENRSFDHYFGSMRGVRGFDDPRALTLPSGRPVWMQPNPATPGGHVAPFHLDPARSGAESMVSLDHSWKGSHALWKNHDAWIAVKSPMSMGYFRREDVPFYYALADAFTVCDAYHCSMFGPTNPNRLYLFTGTSGLTVGETDPIAVHNPPEELNETADRTKDAAAWSGLGWTTYAERLQAAGVSWNVYQEYDNYGDNGLAYFKAFRGPDDRSQAQSRARDWCEGSNADNAATSQGEHLAAAFRRDIETGRLPQVSWIVAPTRLCEHPHASPAQGQAFTAQLIAALADNPEVFAKTVFILNYDENDGLFDHVPPPVPAIDAASGASTVATAGEVYDGQPVGLGPRVPMIVVSPWTKGGFVNSELFDHTSVIRFLETRFGVVEPNISPWRRTVCGDLVSVFDFAQKGAWPETRLPPTAPLVTRAIANRGAPRPSAPLSATILPRQEPGQRPARPLPYWVEVQGRRHTDGGVRLRFENRGRAGAVFQVRAAAGADGPWFHTVGAGKTLTATVKATGATTLCVHGPNGFLRTFGGGAGTGEIEARLDYRPRADRIVMTLINRAAEARTARVGGGGAYRHGAERTYRLRPGERVTDDWIIGPTAHWYDLKVTDDHDPAFERRFAGHMETGKASLSDPAIGRV